MVARQEKIEGREQEEDARSVVIGRRTGDTGDGCAEVEDSRDETGQIAGAQTPAKPKNKGNGGEEESFY